MLIPAALTALMDLFPPTQLFVDRASRLAHRIDAGVISGDPDAVLLVESAADIQRLLAWAANFSVPMIARGAGTGLTGGAVAAQGGIILGLARLNQVVEIDPESRQVVVQPGVVTQTLQKRLVEHDLSYPPERSHNHGNTPEVRQSPPPRFRSAGQCSSPGGGQCRDTWDNWQLPGR